jgi:hypothetical protein
MTFHWPTEGLHDYEEVALQLALKNDIGFKIAQPKSQEEREACSSIAWTVSASKSSMQLKSMREWPHFEDLPEDLQGYESLFNEL